MKKSFFLGLLCCAIYAGGNAQTLSWNEGEADTIELEELVITGIPIEKYAAGAKIQTIPKTGIENGRSSSLDDLLARHSAIYLKEYGHGMLSSVTMRGGSSSHTAVLWNGININLQTVGGFDFSQVPVAAIEKVDIQYGSASSLYGSDAIGGAIHLSSIGEWPEEGFSATLQQEAGSFQTWFTSGTASYSSGPFYVKTTLYRKKSENNFPFVYRSREQKQNHAAYQYYGLIQEAGYRISPAQSLTVSGWFNHNDREVQPNMPANAFPSNENLLDKNFRLSANYKLDHKTGFYSLTSGYVYDHEIYSLDNTRSKIATRRLVNIFQYEKDIAEGLSAKAGGEWTHVTADVDAYERRIVEDRIDGFLSVNYYPVRWWKSTLNIRRTFMQGYKAPFTPSIGSSLTLLESGGGKLTFKTLASKGYRIPTLNDRYYPLSGNPALRPEESWSGEAGIRFDLRRQSGRLGVEASAYAMKIDDLIHWMPAGGDIWIPENVRKASIRGLETHAEFETKAGNLSLLFTGNYFYTRSENKRELSPGDGTAGKQLAYTPKHSANFIAEGRIDRWSASVTNYFTGKRYTNLGNISSLSPYAITGIDLARTFHWGPAVCKATFAANNIFNVRYQNYDAKAMPGINFHAGIRFVFN